MSTPPQIVIDDSVLCGAASSNNCFTFTGAQWGESTTQPDVFQRTMHVVSENSKRVGYSVTFSGTAIEVFGQTNCAAPPCDFDFSLDGARPIHTSHQPTLRSIFQLGPDSIGNSSATHTLTISNTTSYFLVDYALVDAPLDTPLQAQTSGQLWVNINNTAVTYQGGWRKFYNFAKGSESMQGSTVGDSIGFDFIGERHIHPIHISSSAVEGDSILVLGLTDTSFPGSVSVNVSVDNLAPSSQGFFNSPSSSSNSFFIYYNDSSLSPAQHHIQITVASITGGQFFDFYGFMYHSTMSVIGAAVAPTASPASSGTSTSLNPVQSTMLPSDPIPSSAIAGHSKSAPLIAGSVAGAVGAIVVAVLLLVFSARKRRRRMNPLSTPFELERNTSQTDALSICRACELPAESVPFTNPAKGTIPAVVPVTSGGGVSETENTIQGPDDDANTAGILRALIARLDALDTDRGPPEYTA
ncbi:hypothetical protein DFH08DRAFT_855841 [Mycena albidolilacea]|uniref:Transmembrane protein n=1 Tax=Mycena albidolilacea TaxID=1033008 RepID=A0AAD7EXD9_9AGAR|nr:hypothetical protein DFH08DRAFT_855841 [Mycena albidolilacea]